MRVFIGKSINQRELTLTLGEPNVHAQYHISVSHGLGDVRGLGRFLEPSQPKVSRNHRKLRSLFPSLGAAQWHSTAKLSKDTVTVPSALKVICAVS